MAINRVVWVNDLGDFNSQVLWDKVADQQIQDFISYLTVAQQIFNYDAGPTCSRRASSSR